MKICTINVPENYIEAIKKLCGKTPTDFYPSRSEFVRVAIKKQLIIDLELQNILNELESFPENLNLKKIIEKLKHKKPTLEELRALYPDILDFKYINER